MNSNRWISQFVRSNKWVYVLGFALMMLETLCNLAGVGMQKWFIDDVFVNSRFDLLPLYLFLLASFIVAGPILSTLQITVHHELLFSLRVVLFKKIMEQLYRIPIPILQKERTTRYVEYVTTDVNLVGDGVGIQIPRGIRQIAMALLLMASIFYFSPVLLLCVTAFSLSYIVLGRYLAKKVRGLSREVKDRKTELQVQIEEGISSTREIVAYHRAEWEMKLYNILFKRYYESVMQEGRMSNRNLLLSDPLKWLSNLSVLFIGGYLVIKDQLTAGALVVIYQYASQMVGSFQETFNQYLNVNQMLANIDRLNRVTDIEPVRTGEVSMPHSIQSLVFDHVTFHYPENANSPVLDQLSLSIPIGKKVAIVGMSGGGKSTIAKLLIRYYEPTAGQILVNGMPLAEINRDEWHERVAITFQEPYHFPDTVRNNLIFGRVSVPFEKVQQICSQMLLADVIDNLPDGYETEVGERGIMLSGGQRQRLALARAVIGDPEILILDEATSALDMESEQIIQRNLDELRRGKTTIIIAHRLSTIQNADVILVMDQGKVVESGTHEQLARKNGYYARLLLSQPDELAAAFRVPM